MDNVRQPFVFISYRRQDSAAASRWLYQTIQRTFGPTCVFMDTESIRIADNWPDRIHRSLEAATVLIVVIGPSWLGITDEHKRRRIDRNDDWVHNEISHGINNNKTIIPLLLSKTPPPSTDALPDPLKKLAYQQAFELRDDRWEYDLNLLLSIMVEQLGFKKKTERPVRYPKPFVTLKELSPEEIAGALKQLDDKWAIEPSEIPGKEPLKREELTRIYEFASFEDAIDYMSAASKHISSVQHHPRWENIWRTITVWLTTWDIGHKPSQLDIDLAQYLDNLFQSYRRPKKKTR
jgi:pterin-4a-carbinolamine dehydratase